MTELKHGTNGNLGAVAGRSDKGKPIMHTMDPEFILGIAKVSAFGAKKYHMRNFLMEPGMRWSSVYDSLMRHLLAFWSGEELDEGPNGECGETGDPETNMQWSGLPHIHHVAWNVMVLSTYSSKGSFYHGDDRPSSVEYAGGSWKDWQEEFHRAQQDAAVDYRSDAPSVAAAGISERVESAVRADTAPPVETPTDGALAWASARGQYVDVHDTGKGVIAHGHVPTMDELKELVKAGWVTLTPSVSGPTYLGSYRIPLKGE